MNQIQKVSSYLLVAFNIFLIALPLLTLTQWLFIDTGTMKNLLAQGWWGLPVQTPEGCVNLSTVQWTSLSKSMGLSSYIVGSLPLFLSFFVFKSIFRNYQRGEIFTITNAKHYKRLGWFCFWDALLAEPLSNLLITLAVTLSNPPGHRYITISFGSPSLKTFFCGVLVIVISKVMQEASTLHDDQKFTI